MSGRLAAAVAAVAAGLLGAPAAACPCCPTCMVCPCAYQEPQVAPPQVAPPQGQSLVVSNNTVPEVKPAVPSPVPGPLLQCDLNCFGEGATPVPLPGGDGGGVKAESKEICRDFCMATEGCEAFVFGRGMCYGKKDVKTSKCAPGGDYTTEILTMMPYGTCTVMGDPHILTFDNPNGAMGDITQLKAGDYWLFKSTSLSVQGRFGYSKRFPSEASTTGIAMEGPLIQGHKLVVEYVGPDLGRTGFKTFWDGQEILSGTFPAMYDSPDGVLKAQLNDMNPQDFHSQARHTIGGTEGDLPSYLFELQPDIRVYVLLGEETLNVVLTLRRPAGEIDGHCGNFNCDAKDDTLSHVLERGVASPLGATDPASLFDGAPPPPPAQLEAHGEPKTVNDCTEELMQKAEAACVSAPPEVQPSCVFDFCASGGSAGAAAEDLATAAVEEEVTQHFALFGIIPLPTLAGAGTPSLFQLVLFGLSSTLLVGGLSLGWTFRSGDRADGDYLRVAAGGAGAHGEASDEEALLPASEFDELRH